MIIGKALLNLYICKKKKKEAQAKYVVFAMVWLWDECLLWPVVIEGLVHREVVKSLEDRAKWEVTRSLRPTFEK
jgi:hypothetical protein